MVTINIDIAPRSSRFKYGSKNKPSLRDLRTIFYEFEWPGGYGGEMWGDIADAAIMLKEANTVNDKAIWIDHIVDLEHNNDCVFDKEEYLYEMIKLVIVIKSMFDNITDYYQFINKYLSTDVKNIYKDFIIHIRKDEHSSNFDIEDYKAILEEISGYSSYDAIIRDIKHFIAKKRTKKLYFRKLNLQDLLDFYFCFYIKNYIYKYGEDYDIKYFDTVFKERIKIIEDTFYEFLYRACLGEATTDYDGLRLNLNVNKKVLQPLMKIEREKIINAAKARKQSYIKKYKIQANQCSYKDFIDYDYDFDELVYDRLSDMLIKEKSYINLIDHKIKYLFKQNYLKLEHIEFY